MIEALPPRFLQWRLVGLLAGFTLFATGLLLWRICPEWDVDIAARLRLVPGEPAASFFADFTMIGGAAVMVPAALIVAAALGQAGQMRALIWFGLTIASGRIAVEAMKYLVGRARPPVNRHLVDVVTASFPSSHSAGTALTVFAVLAIWRPRRMIWIGGIALIVAIGLSRIMLGVHWPSDVLAGWGFGVFWVSACFARNFSPDGAISHFRPLRARD